MSVEADLTDTYPVSTDQVAFYEANGYVLVPGVLSTETIAEYVPVVERVANESVSAQIPMEQRSIYQRAFLQEMNLWQRIEAMRPLVFSTKLAHIAADLLEVDGVRLYHDQGLLKEAHGGHTPWHCDQYYWPIDSDRTITAWIPLQDVPLEMGPLRFSQGSHRIDLGRDIEIGDRSDDQVRRHPKWRELEVDEQPIAAGDVTFHSGWTFHGSGPNETDRIRLVMTVIYVADGARLAEPRTSGQKLDRKIWLPDVEVGEPVGSWLNPLVWHRSGAHATTFAGLPEVAPMLGTFDLRPS